MHVLLFFSNWWLCYCIIVLGFQFQFIFHGMEKENFILLTVPAAVHISSIHIHIQAEEWVSLVVGFGLNTLNTLNQFINKFPEHFENIFISLLQRFL